MAKRKLRVTCITTKDNLRDGKNAVANVLALSIRAENYETIEKGMKHN